MLISELTELKTCKNKKCTKPITKIVNLKRKPKWTGKFIAINSYSLAKAIRNISISEFWKSNLEN